MIGDPVIAWLLAGIFTLTAAHAAWQLLLAARWSSAVDDTLHLVMSLLMVAMVRPWWSTLPALPPLLFFTAATAWYAVGLFGAARAASWQPARTGQAATHQTMMGARVWMIAVLAPTDPSTAGHQSLSAAAGLVGVGLTAFLTVVAVIAGVDAVASPAGRGRAATDGSRLHRSMTALMAAGMAIMCWQMLAH
ncbi:MAG: DUF5134 domain-containing protein [Propioniciclava sp.]